MHYFTRNLELVANNLWIIVEPKNSRFLKKYKFFQRDFEPRIKTWRCKVSVQKLKMRNLKYKNNLYNQQYVILLCETLENCGDIMHQMYGFNLRRCSEASSLSGYIERNNSKVIIVLPTNRDIVELFEKKFDLRLQLCKSKSCIQYWNFALWKFHDAKENWPEVWL